jgi:ubiquinol-cytochrome c reductase cytochrome b/c1 subunit
VIAGVVVLHIWALHVPGNNNPLGIDVKGPQDTVAFHPYYTMKDGFGIVVFMLVFAGFVFFAPNFMGHADNYIQANRLVTPTHIVPEWYYLPFYAILRSVPDKLIGVLLLFAGIFVWALLPWLDRAHVRSMNFRPVYRYLFFILIVDVAILGYLGAQTADDTNVVIPFTGGAEFPMGKLLLAQIATLYYFAHFLILTPIVSLMETPLPVPESISKAVLAKKGVAASPAAAR